MKNLLIALFCTLLAGTAALAQTTAFTYQGRLQDNGVPVTGSNDVRFVLFDAATAGSQISTNLTFDDLTVSDGLFTVTLDWGSTPFDGGERWLEVRVRPGNAGGPFTTLTPRQNITAAPYAQRATAANVATSANNLTGTVAATQLTGTLADARLSASVSLLGNNIDSTEIVNGTILNVDIDASANIADTKLATINAAGKVANSATTATSANTASAIVARDASGNFSAGTITAGFTGNGSGLTNLNATNLVGAMADARLSTNVALLNTNASFTGEVSGQRLKGGNNHLLTGNLAGIGSGNGNTNQGLRAFVAGGLNNFIQTNAGGSFIGGGQGNVVQSNSASAFIGAGEGNSAASDRAVIGGGQGNTIATNAGWAAIPGGRDNSVAGDYGFAAGRRAKANQSGTFVWADAQNADFASTVSNTFLIRAQNGVGINKANPATTLDVNGTVTATGFSGNGAGLTNLSPSALGAGVVTNPVVFLNSNSTFSGNGSGLTNINIAQNSGGAIQLYDGYALASSPAVGEAPNEITTADVNGDGRPDLISANYGADTLTILTNNGSGGFVLSSSPSGGNGPGSVTSADVNGDGRPDLITSNGPDNTLTILTNNGSGGFVLSSSPSVGTHPSSVTTADVNGDSKPDLINANADANTLTVLTNSGQGGFVLSSTHSVGNEPISVTTADVNGDGKPDLISANYHSANLTILTNNGSGGFVLSSSPSVGNQPSSVAAADLNGDGRTDLVSANFLDGSLTLLMNYGGFILFPSPSVNDQPYSVITADMNGDGKADIITASYTADTITVLTNDGGASFTVSQAFELPSGTAPFSLTAADFNGDGQPDLASANYYVDTVSVFLTSKLMNFTGRGRGLTGVSRLDAPDGSPAPALSVDNNGNVHAVGTITSSSDRNRKEHFTAVNPGAVLEKVSALTISEWSYKADSQSHRHIGPMAQDFHAAFTVGVDDKTISMVDANGVALAAIQGLNEKVETGHRQADDRLQQLEAENAELKARLEKLERILINPR